jgi:hypothetical protein
MIYAYICIVYVLLLILILSLRLYCITEPIYWLFLHPLDILLYMVLCVF